jgi:hypothetical protein
MELSLYYLKAWIQSSAIQISIFVLFEIHIGILLAINFIPEFIVPSFIFWVMSSNYKLCR